MMPLYDYPCSVIIRPLSGVVRIEIAHCSHKLEIDGNFEGYFESYQAAVERAVFLTTGVKTA